MSRPSRAAWIVGGSLFSVAAIGFGTLNVVDAVAHERSSVHVEITDPINVIDLDSSAGSVRIEGTDASTVVVDARVSEGLRKGHHSERVEGDHLVIRASCPGIFGTWCGVDYTIRVPRGTSITATSSNAGIQITNIDGDLQLSSSDGSIRAGNIGSSSVRAISSDGSVVLGYAAPPREVRASSSDGSVTIEVPDTPDAYRVDASASDGGTDISVRTDPTSSRVIEAHSSDGSVTVRYP